MKTIDNNDTFFIVVLYNHDILITLTNKATIWIFMTDSGVFCISYGDYVVVVTEHISQKCKSVSLRKSM